MKVNVKSVKRDDDGAISWHNVIVETQNGVTLPVIAIKLTMVNDASPPVLDCELALNEVDLLVVESTLHATIDGTRYRLVDDNAEMGVDVDELFGDDDKSGSQEIKQQKSNL